MHFFMDMHTMRYREEPAAKPQRENGKSLSYAAVIADSCAPQQPAGNQPTSAEPTESAPAEEGNASGRTDSAAPAVGAEAGAAADAKSGNSRQSKSGLRQPLVWLDLEMTGASMFLSHFHHFCHALHISHMYGGDLGQQNRLAQMMGDHVHFNTKTSFAALYSSILF